MKIISSTLVFARKHNGYLALALGLLLLSGEALAQEETAAVVAPLGLKLLMRWMHILSACGLLGGMFFMRFVLIPAVGTSVSTDEVPGLHNAVMARWRKFVLLFIVAFLVSGFYNYLFVTRHAHTDDPTYHMLFGIKFLLSLAIFALASILISGRKRPSKIRDKASGWLLVVLGLVTAVVVIAGYMKVM
jgi:uncharacterized membrane protein